MKNIFSYSFILVIAFSFSCKKESNNASNSNPGGGNNGGSDTTVVVTPTDPPVENTIGFFLDNWQQKNFTLPAYTDVSVLAEAPSALVKIDGSQIITKVPSSVFGQNANIWMSQMVTEPVLM